MQQMHVGCLRSTLDLEQEGTFNELTNEWGDRDALGAQLQSLTLKRVQFLLAMRQVGYPKI